jgi:single-strand DNA-binding protein
LKAATSLPCRIQTIGVNKNIFINNLNLHAMNTLKNRVQLIGNVGNDPEIKTLEGGKKLASLSIATNESYTNEKGEKVEQTEWHRVTAWGKTAEIIEKYVTKGKEVAIEGKLSHRSYDDKNGEKRYITEVIVSGIQMFGKN